MMEWYRTCSISFNTQMSERLVNSFWVDFYPLFLIWHSLPILGLFSFVEGEIEDELKDWCYFIRILLENSDWDSVWTRSFIYL